MFRYIAAYADLRYNLEKYGVSILHTPFIVMEVTMANVIELKSFDSPELDVFARLKERQICPRDERDDALFIAESPNVIERALDSGYTPISLLMERKHIEGQAKRIIERCPGVPVYTSTLDVLTQLTGYKLTRGVLCAMQRKPEPSVDSICRDARRIAVLENVVNPTNVGAIFRSAAAMGIDAVLLTPGCSDPLYRRSARVSMGTVFQVPWTRIGFEVEDWPEPGITILKALGFKTVAMALSDDSVRIDDPRLMSEEKLAIVLGTEGDGLAKSTIATCDYTAKIPMTNGVDSLNVAAAGAVAFWQLAGISAPNDTWHISPRS